MRTLTRLALAGPFLFVGLVALTDVLQYDWLVSIGQSPLHASPVSVNAWGPWGALQYVAFAAVGVAVLCVAVGLDRVTDGRRISLATTAFVGLAFLASVPRCDCEPGFVNASPIPGAVHNLAFSGIMLGLLVATFSLAVRFWSYPGWRGSAVHSLVTGLLLVPALVVGSVLESPDGPHLPGFYVFLLVMPLQWVTVLALRLRREVQRRDEARGPFADRSVAEVAR